MCSRLVCRGVIINICFAWIKQVRICADTQIGSQARDSQEHSFGKGNCLKNRFASKTKLQSLAIYKLKLAKSTILKLLISHACTVCSAIITHRLFSLGAPSSKALWAAISPRGRGNRLITKRSVIRISLWSLVFSPDTTLALRFAGREEKDFKLQVK